MWNLMRIKALSRMFLIAFMLIIMASGQAISQTQSASEIGLTIDPSGSLLKIALNGEVKTRTFILGNPERWVIDITPAKWSRDVKSKYQVEKCDYLSLVRTGQWQEKTARLVLHTKGMEPSYKNLGGEIVITFENSTPLVTDELISLPEPTELLKERPMEQEEDTSTDLKTSNPEELKATYPAVKFSGRKGEIQAVGSSDKSEDTKDDNPQPEIAKKDFLVEKVASSDITTDPASKPTINIPPAAAVAGSGTEIRMETDKGRDFEVMTDGTETVISIKLNSDRSFNVKRGKFPERLIIEYPSLTGVIQNDVKVLYSQTSREKLPIGIIESCSRFESTNPSGYQKLIFYSKGTFEYKTRIENNTLNVVVKGTAQEPVISEQNPEIALNNASSETTSESEVVLQKADNTAQTEEKGFSVKTVSESNKDNTNQKFSPPDKKSFVVDEVKNDEHTTPQSGLNFIIKDVEATNVIQAGASEMLKFLPEHANKANQEAAKSLNTNSETGSDGSTINVPGGPLMFEPPESSVPLPKGTRPAADLFLTKGESVIVPTESLVRASVGDPNVIVVNVLSQEELLVTAKDTGQTTLILWEEGIGRSVRWVNVGKSNLLKTIEVEKVINNPGLKVNFVGDKTVVIEGKVQTEEEMNRAVSIAKGAAENVVNLIQMSDPRQVLVKVRFVEIQSKDKDDFLNKFGSGTRTEQGDFQFNILTDIMDPEFASGGIFDISLHPGIVKGNSGDERFDPLDFMFTWLEQNRKGRVLSQPNLVTMSGHEAHFRVGGEIPYTYKNENGFNVVNFREFGVELTVTPNVDSLNNINMSVNPVVRMPDFTIAIAGIPGFKTREVKTNIQISDSQTIVIGGLLQHEVTTSKSKVPLLGDIPLMGQLFTSKKSSTEETELLIFLTPMILKDISAVENDIRSDEDVSLSPYYQKEYKEAETSDD